MFKNLCFLFLFLPTSGFTQKIVRTVMMGDQGETTDPSAAKYILLEKNFGDTLFERVGYRYAGPLVKIVSYKDAAMTSRDGIYEEYDEGGYRVYIGTYRHDKKDGDWFMLDKEQHVIEHKRYRSDTLLFDWGKDSILFHHRIDSLDLQQRRDSARLLAHLYGLDKRPKSSDARFKGGDKAWDDYVTAQLGQYPERARSLHIEGTVSVEFAIDTLGNVCNIDILHSVEMSLDENLITALSHSPRWAPYTWNGHPFPAFRGQKITFRLPN